MSEAKRIKTALVSVYHKEGLDEIITKLHEVSLAKRWRILLLIPLFWADV